MTTFRTDYSTRHYQTWIVWGDAECVIWAGVRAPEGDTQARERAEALTAALAASPAAGMDPLAVRAMLAPLCGQPLHTRELAAERG